MNISAEIEDFERELQIGLAFAEKELISELVEVAPVEMRELFSDNPPSAIGSPPANRTKGLYYSLGANGDDSIVMAEHAFYLDPVFEGQGKGGGWANRPFIEKGLDQALVKIAKPL